MFCGRWCASRALRKPVLHRRVVPDPVLDPPPPRRRLLPPTRLHPLPSTHEDDRHSVLTPAATSKNLQTPSARTPLSNSLHCTLLQPPPQTLELQSELDSQSGVTRGFALLSRDANFSLGSVGRGEGEGLLQLSQEEAECVSRFKQTPFYHLMFRLCEPSLKQSDFWSEISVVPCRMWKDGRWEIAWDVMTLLTLPERRNVFERLTDTLTQLSRGVELPARDLFSQLKQVHDWCEDFPVVKQNDTIWKAFQRFLNHSVLFLPDQFPAVSLQAKETGAGNLKVTGCRVNAHFVDYKAVSRELRHRGIVQLPSKGGTLLPISSSWFLAFIAVQKLLPDVVPRVNVERLKRVLGVGAELPVDVVVERVQSDSKKNKIATATGNAVLRLVTLLNRWQLSSNTTLNNSKAQSVSSTDEIRNSVLGEILRHHPAVAEILLEWAVYDQESASKLATAYNVNWQGVLDRGAVEWDLDPGEVRFLVPETDMGRTFKAFVAGCFEVLGMASVWELCARIGLVGLKGGSPMVEIVQSWRQGGDEEPWGTQEWEKYHIDKYLSVLFPAYEDFCRDFGYTFHQKYRFDFAVHHPSFAPQRTAVFGWMALLGKAILELFVQDYVARTQPNVGQTAIYGVFNDGKRAEICFSVAFEMKLHEISLCTIPTVVRLLARNYKDKEVLKKDSATRGLLSLVMMAVIGAMAIDNGMDVKRVMALLEKPFAAEIESCTDKVGASYHVVERYVPTKIEMKTFLESDLPERTYHSTLIQFLRQKDDQKPFFAFYLLTRAPLEEFPEWEILHETDGVTFVKRVRVFDEVVEIGESRHGLLMEFQSEWFEPILPPFLERVQNGDQTKKYLVAPAVRDETKSDAIDWTLVRAVVKKSIPTEIARVRRNFATTQSVDRADLKAATQSVVELDAGWQFQEDTTDRENAVPVDALHKLLFLTKQGEVVAVSEGIEFKGEVLNGQCMMDPMPLLYRTSTPARTIAFKPTACRCLPYTLSYFRCLSVVPFVLDLMERKLLAEDYRRRYSLPDAIPSDSLLLSLTVGPIMDSLKFGRLEALGHAVMCFVYTLQVLSDLPREDVGKLSFKRIALMNSREISTKMDEHLLLGHLMATPFSPYRDTMWWYPPANAPYSFKAVGAGDSAADDSVESEREVIETPPLVITPLEGRLGTGMMQNVSKGVPHKHFKAVAALCFLHGGIEAGLDYLRRIGTTHLSSYPKAEAEELELSRRLKKYDALQEHLQYKFSNVATLASAFMHSSVFNAVGKNNEKLEFIGDAVLELCIWHYIHCEYPDITVAQAVKLKMDLTNNNLFCWVALEAPLELHKLLMHSVEGFTEAVMAMKRSKNVGSMDSTFSKTASDAFEALFGAVFVDSGYSLEVTGAVMRRVMKDVLNDLARYGIEDPLAAE